MEFLSNILRKRLLRGKCFFTNFKNVLQILVYTCFEYSGLNHSSFPEIVSFYIVAFKYWTVYNIIIESTFFEGFFKYGNNIVKGTATDMRYFTRSKFFRI